MNKDIDPTNLVVNWRKEKIDKLDKEQNKYRELGLKQLTEADRYYCENDLMSKLLSKFLKNYPKNI